MKRVLLPLAMLGTASFVGAQSLTIVNDFGAGGPGSGWQSDDTRNALNQHIINVTTHAPLAGGTLDSAGVAAQIDWLNTNGSRGNLGGVRLDGTASASGKSTLSVVDAVTGLGASSLLTVPTFSTSYRWQNNDTVAPGLAYKIGIQSTQWGASQTGFTPSRSGEGAWDLLLVYDPAEPGNQPGNTTTNGSFHTSTITATSGKFYLFDQSGNAYYTPPGVGTGKTLAEWALDPTWGPLLFGAGAKISSTQFGLGSGNAGAAATLDFASISYLNSGAMIDFADGIKWTNAAGGNIGVGANWAGGAAPGAAVNGLFDLSGTYTVSVPSDTTVRSLGVSLGNVTFDVASGQNLVLANGGYLFAESGAVLSTTGAGVVSAAVLDSVGTINIATVTNLDGGSLPHPVRDGTNPLATTRYGLVVEAGGTVNLLSGTDVTVSQTNKNVGVRVGEGIGTGTLNIAAGASLEVGNTDSFGVNGLTSNGFIVVGDFGSTGVVNQTGGTVLLTDGSFNLGNQGGTGTWSISAGSLTLAGGLHSFGRSAGANPGGSGTVNISGSALMEVTASLNNGPATLVNGDRDPGGSSNGAGIINQSGGTLRVAPGNTFYLGGHGSSQYNLTGGTLEIGGGSLQELYANSGTGSYAFNLGGGTIKVIGSSLSTSADLTTLASTESKLDLNGLGATLSGNVSGATNGALNVVNGSLTFNGTQINGANVRVGVGGTTVTAGLAANSTLTIANSGALRVGSVDPNVAGIGILNLAAGQTIDFVPGGAGATSLRVGSGGAGTLNQSGGLIDADKAGFTIFQVGTVAGGNGTFNQTGGLVKLGSNAFVGYFGATGVWTLSGSAEAKGSVTNVNFFELGAGGAGTSGTLNLQDNAQMTFTTFSNIGIGGSPNDQVAATGNTGTLNQTGAGTSFTQGSGYLFFGFDSGTTGTYNLSAGTFSTAAGTTFASQSGSAGSFVQTGGVATFSNGFAFGAGHSVYTLNGGTLQIGGLNGISQMPGGTHLVTFGGGTIRVTGTSLSTAVSATLTAATVSKIDTNGLNATFSGVLSGSGGLEKQGDGQLTLSQTNTYSGTTTITAGTVEVTADGGLGSEAAGTTVADGATLKLTDVNYSTAEAVTLNGNGVGGGGALVNSGTSTFAGQVTAATDTKINAGGGTLNLTGGLVKDGTTATLTGGGRINISGPISGASPNSDLEIDGTTVVVSSANTYNGPTTVQNGGTLVANNPSGSATGTGTVTIDSTSTISGTGGIVAGTGNFVYMNGALVVGDSTLASPVASSLTLNTSGPGSTVIGGNAFLFVDLFSGAGIGDNTSDPLAADYITFFGTVDIGPGAMLVVGNPNSMSSFAYGDSWKIIDWAPLSSVTGSFGIDFSALNLGPSLSGVFDQSSGTFSVVPEPSRALLLLFGGMGMLLRRRRCRRPGVFDAQASPAGGGYQPQAIIARL